MDEYEDTDWVCCGDSGSVGAQQWFWVWRGHSGIVYMELHQLRTESGRLEGTSAKDVGVWGHGKGCHGPPVLFSLQEKLQLRGPLLVLGLTYSCHMCWHTVTAALGSGCLCTWNSGGTGGCGAVICAAAIKSKSGACKWNEWFLQEEEVFVPALGHGDRAQKQLLLGERFTAVLALSLKGWEDKVTWTLSSSFNWV